MNDRMKEIRDKVVRGDWAFPEGTIKFLLFHIDELEKENEEQEIALKWLNQKIGMIASERDKLQSRLEDFEKAVEPIEEYVKVWDIGEAKNGRKKHEYDYHILLSVAGRVVRLGDLRRLVELKEPK